MQLTEDKSDRRDLSIVSNDLKKLSRSTVQILVDAEGASSLYGGASGHGTGFFISKDGLLLTNNHVAEGLKECMSFYKCKMSLKQVDEENKSTHFTADAELLATDIEMDFALLKIKVPPEIEIESLDIENQEVEASLISLGYPRDENETRDRIPLVYSFGKLVGTYDLGYTTSIYVAGGASGSAVMNLNNKKVVAIMSNAKETSTADKTGPGIARPIQMINFKFNIDDYLNGSKEARVIKILQMLKVSANISEATQALEEFDQERTYLGLGTIKSIMLSHTEISVRKLIMTFLGKRGFITGPQEE